MPRLNRDRTADSNKRPTKRSNAENGDFDLEALQRMQKGKKSLRIDDRTIVLVRPEKCNDEYRKIYKERMNNNW